MTLLTNTRVYALAVGDAIVLPSGRVVARGDMGDDWREADGEPELVSPACLAAAVAEDEWLALRPPPKVKLRRRTADAGPRPIREPDEVTEFVEACVALHDRCEDLPECAEEFGASVQERLLGMATWARTNGVVTAAMAAALDNMEAGVGAWR